MVNEFVGFSILLICRSWWRRKAEWDAVDNNYHITADLDKDNAGHQASVVTTAKSTSLVSWATSPVDVLNAIPDVVRCTMIFAQYYLLIINHGYNSNSFSICVPWPFRLSTISHQPSTMSSSTSKKVGQSCIYLIGQPAWYSATYRTCIMHSYITISYIILPYR